ncbi:exonuclease SbcCD subunit D [Thermotoga sp. SG1]|uniref:metallophosphoesterase family protein n=1 Tax=Thermotoga sp. SG1 TaxID=126739 RepID=UPI000C79461A|nr:exonuclease SbcCD subunit D [Thermotoga sp. SG1]
MIELEELKLLHTADWHFGLTSWSSSKPRDRRAEINEALDRVIEEARKEGVDLFLVAGDLLHNRSNPGVLAIKDVMEVLKKMLKIAPVVVLLGNHDWRGLTAFGDLLQVLSDDLVFLRYPEPVDVVAGRGQKVRILPFPYPEESEDLEAKISRGRDFRQWLEKKLAKLKEAGKEDFAVFVGHFTVEGLEPYAGAEQGREVVINRNLIPFFADYVALGHLHGFHVVQEQPLMIYSGSPIRLDFGEEKDEKGAVLVVVKKGSEPVFRKIDTNPLPLKTLFYRTLDTSARREIKDFCRTFPGYVRITYEEDPLNMAHELLGEIDNVVKVEKRIEKVFQSGVDDVREEISKLDFFELFKEYVKTRVENHENLIKLLEELLEEVKGNET